MSLSHVAEDSALRNEDDATGYRTETAWLRLMPHEGGVACDLRDCRHVASPIVASARDFWGSVILVAFLLWA